jgi:hypothetical protein
MRLGLAASGVIALLMAATVAVASGASTTAAEPCSLVTKAEAAKSLGLPLAKLKRTVATGFLPDWDCTYTERKAGLKRRPRDFALFYRDYTDEPDTYRALMNKRFAGGRKQPGLGESASWTRDHDLVVFVRLRMLRFELFGFSRAKSEPRMKALARKAIARLPA